MGLDLDLPRMDDDIVLPDAEAFPTTAPQAPAGSGILESWLGIHREQESSESAEAPVQRKRRSPKSLPVDERQELHTTDLTQWKTDYLANMAEATAAKKSHKAPFLAKKNAAFWVVGAGIGGIGAGLGSSKLQSPLDMFAGDAMMEALTGVKVTTSGQKRGRDEEEDYNSDSEARRVRIRDGDGDQIGRGDDMMLDDDGTMMISANDVSTSIVGESFPQLTIFRQSKLVVMLRQRSKILLCHGISAQPSALVKAPLSMVVVLPAVSAGSLPVLALLALCHLLRRVPAHWTNAPAELPVPVLSSAAGANVTAVWRSLLVKMMMNYSVVATSPMTKRLMTSSSMVPLPPLILKQLGNHSG